jgi:hypothetical protein
MLCFCFLFSIVVPAGYGTGGRIPAALVLPGGTHTTTWTTDIHLDVLPRLIRQPKDVQNLQPFSSSY